jgi:hypothetical protein
MQVTAWNNGRHHGTGAGYGFKLRAEDRDRHFKQSWPTVFVSLPDCTGEVEVNISKASFWGATCRELISREFGRWLQAHQYAPWAPGTPPTFQLVPTHTNHFRLTAR